MSEQDPHHQSEQLDEALEETFPASDAPANTVETGIRLKTADGLDIVDNVDARRFEHTIDGQTAFLAYERTSGALVIVHTEVPPALQGRRLGPALVQHALDVAHREGLRIVVICPYAREYLRRHPPTRDIGITVQE